MVNNYNNINNTHSNPLNTTSDRQNNVEGQTGWWDSPFPLDTWISNCNTDTNENPAQTCLHSKRPHKHDDWNGSQWMLASNTTEREHVVTSHVLIVEIFQQSFSQLWSQLNKIVTVWSLQSLFVQYCNWLQAEIAGNVYLKSVYIFVRSK